MWQHKTWDARVARLSTVVANSAGSKTRPEDFMPEYPEQPTEETRMTAEQTADMLKGWAVSMGGSVK